jgi:hypothetical protein
MMTAYFGGDPPPSFTIAVTQDSVKQFSVTYKDASGNPLNWPGEVYLAVDVAIDSGESPTTVDATVDGNVAAFLLSVALCNAVLGVTAWRLYMTNQPGDDGLPFALTVGNFERDDGG